MLRLCKNIVMLSMIIVLGEYNLSYADYDLDIASTDFQCSDDSITGNENISNDINSESKKEIKEDKFEVDSDEWYNAIAQKHYWEVVERVKENNQNYNNEEGKWIYDNDNKQQIKDAMQVMITQTKAGVRDTQDKYQEINTKSDIIEVSFYNLVREIKKVYEDRRNNLVPPQMPNRLANILMEIVFNRTFEQYKSEILANNLATTTEEKQKIKEDFLSYVKDLDMVHYVAKVIYKKKNEVKKEEKQIQNSQISKSKQGRNRLRAAIKQRQKAGEY